MIVRDDGAALCLITQPDHAALAAQVMAAWCADGFADRPTRAAALAATADHDAGWTAFDAAPIVHPDTGRPADFVNAPASLRQAVWHRALDDLPHRSTYVAALVAQHALSIYRRYRGDPSWTAFLAHLEQARDHWFTRDTRPDGSSGGPLDPALDQRRAFLQDYAIVATGDLLSLTFCSGWTARQQAEGYAIALSGAELRVAPDPFGGARVPIRIAARRIPNRRYDDDADLRAALRAAVPADVEGVVCGADTL